MADQYEKELSEMQAIILFKELGYAYQNGKENDQRDNITEVVLKDQLLKAISRLNPWLDDENHHKAFEKISSVLGASLMEINQQIWDLIRSDTFSVKQSFDGVEEYRALSYIDYNEITNNDFLVINQFKVRGKGRNSIPDLVVFINGLPVAVIECKSPAIHGAGDQAISDLIHYQENSEKLFHYNQLCVGIWRDGGKYGAINAPHPFYSVFKTQKGDTLISGVNTEQDKLLYSIFKKENLLDIIRHFVVFELNEGRTIKKLPRYQQIRATNNTIAKLQTGQGGVVWHTQGSGKSLTMAYVIRKLRAPEYGFNNPTIIVLTDRIDLDTQINGTFNAIGLRNVHKASSVYSLEQLLRNDYGGIITTTLQKFQQSEKEATGEFEQPLDEEEETFKVEKSISGGILIKVTKVLVDGKWEIRGREEIQLEELSNKKNLYVLVDEAHRSHYGFLAAFMRTALPHAKFIAFTGTPISNDEKSTLGEFYGGDYIDVYTILDSVADGATVELLYDAGIDKLNVKKEELDADFEIQFKNESAEKKEKLKSDALRNYQFSTSRIDAIASHIITHFREKIFANGHKAMLVCDGRYGAVCYKQAFERLRELGIHDFETKVVVSMGSSKSSKIDKDYYEAIEHNKQNPLDQKPVWLTAPEDIKDVTIDFKLPYGNINETEKSGKKKFDNTAILIVSDMLLTGYDAPLAACLYLDKPLKEHNLLQAITRVNRTGNRKVAGFIMDYIGITDDLLHALKIFSGDVRPDDILKNIECEFPKLVSNHQNLIQFFRLVKFDRIYLRSDFIDAAIRYIEPLDLRDEFKELLKKFNKSIAIVLPSPKATAYKADSKLFNEIKLRARNFYPEDEELKVSKEESLLLQKLIDEHLESTGIESLLGEPISIFDSKKFRESLKDASQATKELKMRNNLTYVIKVGFEKNPDLYKPLAQRLDELLRLKDEKRISQHQLILEMWSIQNDLLGEQQKGIEKGFVTEQQRAVYNSVKIIFVDNGESATKELFELIRGDLGIIEWDTKSMVINAIETKISRYLKEKMEWPDAKIKARDLVAILKNNKDA